MQILGYTVDTSTLKLSLPPLHEETINLSPMTDGTAAYAQNLDWTGVLLAAANEAAGYTFMVPQNMVENVIQYLWISNGASAPALDTSDTFTVDVSGGVSSETNTTTMDGITATGQTLTDNDVLRVDVSTGFDATGLLKPGNVIGVDIDKAAEGTTGDDHLILALAVVIRCV
jgi:hypothetical protein